MKKGQTYEGIVSSLEYASHGIVMQGDNKIKIKGALPGQKINYKLSKNRRTNKQGKVIEVLERAPYEVASFCEHFGECGGCARQTVPYEEQLNLKKTAVESLFTNANINIKVEEVIASPKEYEYRNKMEYSFGDAEKGGQLNLGMHRKGRFYDVVSIPNCHLIDSDYRTIINTIETLSRDQDWGKFDRNREAGLLRHVVVRKGQKTGELLVGISTTSSPVFDEKLFVDTLLGLELEGTIVGIYHLVNDGLGDVVKPNPEDKLIYGRDYFYEELFDLKFKISFFSFFQTNSLGAEVLYQTAVDMIDDIEGQTIFDLFSGTGTIGQIVAKKAKKVIGVEIIEDAVKAANVNAVENNIENCEFIAGDVFQVLQDVHDRPEVIIVDPPRAGILTKAVGKIASYGAQEIIYVSCNPKTMVEDLEDFISHGYCVDKCKLVDMYPHTDHVEAVVKLTKK
ncbi:MULTISPECIES: 23S rRNA (uracil(1939)-C(5))-methyltransferase RlmD [unclassified Fusibacter]|uniref:23S rRNA (uracil(1939)-C(5))-methyltransferase RlmD n=1 Tax=unclassified Fusibacter TaxID=2624464 RepID=UPI0013E93E1A|nr:MULTISPECIES: 23S rRNA (uracil(1939)-C(5))-methyltransferase RlmD [unclassified Fusibacter]MCK8060719.1 23S rRNA (uracil(1939)-C(5))-methyltransferase RlmD [Fusibacter sp. A2]NPE22827.1 23S rRNA (uracil(1939)-C(5))-methyltransferase RlmD [Fusibacter sp. A1]